MPYCDRSKRDRPDDYSLTDSDDACTTPPPRRPRPVVTTSSSCDASPTRRKSRRRDYSHREQSYKDRVKEPRRKPSSGHNERSPDKRRNLKPEREERVRPRIDRAASKRDPERAAKKARREERAAHDPEYAARRRQRRAARRAERRSSRQIELPQEQTQDLTTAEQEKEEKEDTASSDKNVAQPLPRAPERNVNDDPPSPTSGSDQDYAHEDLDYCDPYAPTTRDRGRYTQRRSNRDSPRPAGEPSWRYCGDDWNLESSSIDEKKYSRSTSAFSELDYFKRYTMPSRHSQDRYERRNCCGFGERCCIISLMIAAAIMLVIIIAVPVVVSRNKFSYIPSMAQVNETAAFSSGAATHNSVNDTSDGIGAGVDAYTDYKGNATKMLADVPSSKWVSFEDMWNNNLATLQQSCGWLDYGANDSPDEIQDLYNAIQDRANASLVDHRLILAFVLQESRGCVRVPNTESTGGVKNTGLMQAHHGHEYTSKHQQKSILYMIQDGTQGTKKGNGIVQELNAYYGNPYAAARAYNSGYIPTSGDLSEAAGATACYVSDIANRLTGWVSAKSTCSDSGH